jgi:hypothetical protein
VTEKRELEGLGGWLLLVGLALVLSPIVVMVTAMLPLATLFTNGSWELLTTPGAEAYHPLFKPILIGEMLINGALVLAYMAAVLLFLGKRALFPKVYIGLLLLPLVLIPLDSYLLTFAMPDEPVFDPETTKALGRSVVAAGIWIPYMLNSERVKATFVR